MHGLSDGPVVAMSELGRFRIHVVHAVRRADPGGNHTPIHQVWRGPDVELDAFGHLNPEFERTIWEAVRRMQMRWDLRDRLFPGEKTGHRLAQICQH